MQKETKQKEIKELGFDLYKTYVHYSKSNVITFDANNPFKDKDLFIEVFKKNAIVGLNSIQFISKELLEDKSFIIRLLKMNGYAYNRLPEYLRENKEIAYAALLTKEINLRYIAKKLKSDREFVFNVISEKKNKVRHIHYSLRRDVNFMWDIMKKVSVNSFIYALGECKKDRAMVIYAIERDGDYFRHIDESLYGDLELINIASKTSGAFLSVTTDEVKDNKHYVMMAVAHNGYNLHYASERLQGDRDVVLTAYATTPAIAPRWWLHKDSAKIIAEIQN